MYDRSLVTEILEQIIVSHHYFDLDADVIFSICQDHIDDLLKTLKKILQEMQR